MGEMREDFKQRLWEAANKLRSARPMVIAITSLLTFNLSASRTSAQVYGYIAKCEINVHNEFKFEGICFINESENELYSILTVYPFTEGTIRHKDPEYFFYLDMESDGLSTWNSEPYAGHAHYPLGNIISAKDNCYFGEKFEICADPLLY